MTNEMDYILLAQGMGLGISGARRLGLYRPLTPEERLTRDLRRGGFPLLRKEACDPAPGRTIRGETYNVTFKNPATAVRMPS